MPDDPRALAAQAAEVMEAALDSDDPSRLPTTLLQEYRAGIDIARAAADPNTPDADVPKLVATALAQLAEPPRVFMNDDVRRAGQTARMLLDRARHVN